MTGQVVYGSLAWREWGESVVRTESLTVSAGTVELARRAASENRRPRDLGAWARRLAADSAELAD